MLCAPVTYDAEPRHDSTNPWLLAQSCEAKSRFCMPCAHAPGTALAGGCAHCSCIFGMGRVGLPGISCPP